MADVLGFVEDASVECKPGKLAIDEAIG